MDYLSILEKIDACQSLKDIGKVDTDITRAFVNGDVDDKETLGLIKALNEKKTTFRKTGKKQDGLVSIRKEAAQRVYERHNGTLVTVPEHSEIVDGREVLHCEYSYFQKPRNIPEDILAIEILEEVRRIRKEFQGD